METHYHPETSHHQLSGSWQEIFVSAFLKHTGPYFVYFVGLGFLACVGTVGGDSCLRSCTCITGVEFFSRKENVSAVLQELAPDLYCWSLLSFGLGKLCLVMHFSCHVFLCPQEKYDRVRKAVMKPTCSYLSSLFWLRRSGRGARYLSCFAAGMQSHTMLFCFSSV